ncbi:MAG: 50S ribosomal protein L19 [Candidatus Omnitrophica bacterium]|jgi:large subunit ribosomal protein L19|nr:50S ribosomal protein L19 [Candidatus Omnitrophota bacterium]
MHPKVIALENEIIPKKDIPVFYPGDEIEISIKIKEGEKEREQIFSGICIAKKGIKNRETFTVRKISYGEGVERIFPVNSMFINKIKILKTRKNNKISPRAKLYYIRNKQ